MMKQRFIRELRLRNGTKIEQGLLLLLVLLLGATHPVNAEQPNPEYLTVAEADSRPSSRRQRLSVENASRGQIEQRNNKKEPSVAIRSRYGLLAVDEVSGAHGVEIDESITGAQEGRVDTIERFLGNSPFSAVGSHVLASPSRHSSSEFMISRGMSAGPMSWWFGTSSHRLKVSGEVRSLTAQGVWLPMHESANIRSFFAGSARFTHADRVADAIGFLDIPSDKLTTSGNISAYHLRLGGGYEQRVGRATIGAYAAADLSRMEFGSLGYRDMRLNGATDVLTDGHESRESVSASAGLRASFNQVMSWGTMIPQLSISYQREFERSDEDNRYNGTERRTHADFSLAPAGSAERWQLGLGTQMDTSQGLRLFMFYQGEMGQDMLPIDGVVRAGVSARF